MFEAAEAGNRVSRQDFDEQEPRLRVDLLNAQYDLQFADFPVILLISGDDAYACNDTLHVLHSWMDARYIVTNAFGLPTDEEAERPRFWRYWRVLPPKGRIGVYLGAWPLNTIARRFRGQASKTQFEHDLTHIRRFEEALADDGAIVLKFWMHLPDLEFRKRVKEAGKHRDADQRLEDADWRIYEDGRRAMRIAEHLIRVTSTGQAPWTVVESTDRRHRVLTVTRTLLPAIQARLASPGGAACAGPTPAGIETPAPPRGALDGVDLAASLDAGDYRAKMDKYRHKLRRRAARARDAGLTSVIILEGWDAAGKGGVIRRITRVLPPRDYVLIPIAAPSEEERAHHYLWRFWRCLPRAGRMLIFDRSWYGRVLVERVEGLARPEAWRRAYDEINDFEEQLVEHGMVLVKFWLHIDPDEQLRRFEARAKTPYKKYKLTEEDHRNRDRWRAYTDAVNEMVARTSTEVASWHLVAADDKRWARVEVVRTVAAALKRGLKAASRRRPSRRSPKLRPAMSDAGGSRR